MERLNSLVKLTESMPHDRIVLGAYDPPDGLLPRVAGLQKSIELLIRNMDCLPRLSHLGLIAQVGFIVASKRIRVPLEKDKL